MRMRRFVGENKNLGALGAGTGLRLVQHHVRLVAAALGGLVAAGCADVDARHSEVLLPDVRQQRLLVLVVVGAVRTLERLHRVVRSLVQRQLLRRRQLPSADSTHEVGRAAVVRDLVTSHQAAQPKVNIFCSYVI